MCLFPKLLVIMTFKHPWRNLLTQGAFVLRRCLLLDILELDSWTEFDAHVNWTPHLIDIWERQRTNRMNKTNIARFCSRCCNGNYLLKIAAGMRAFPAAWCLLVGVMLFEVTGLTLEDKVWLSMDDHFLDLNGLCQAHPINWYWAISTIDKLIVHHDISERRGLLVIGLKPFHVWKVHYFKREMADFSICRFLIDTLKLGRRCPNFALWICKVYKIQSCFRFRLFLNLWFSFLLQFGAWICLFGVLVLCGFWGWLVATCLMNSLRQRFYKMNVWLVFLISL